MNNSKRISFLFFGILLSLSSCVFEPKSEYVIDIVAFFGENLEQQKINIEDELLKIVNTKSIDTLLIKKRFLVISDLNSEIKQLNDLQVYSHPIINLKGPFPFPIPPIVIPPCDESPKGGCLPFSLSKLFSFPNDGNTYLLEFMDRNGRILFKVETSSLTQVRNGSKNVELALPAQMLEQVKLKLTVKETEQSFMTSEILFR